MATTLTILIVEDDPMIRSVFSDLLRLEGYRVLEASGGHSAIAFVRDNNIDLILSDIQMPDGDGFFLLQELNKIKHAPPLLFVSSDSTVSEKDVIKQGAVALFPKPIEFAELIKQVAHLLQKSNRMSVSSRRS